MSSTFGFFTNPRLFLARISPVVQIQRRSLQARRKKALLNAVKEQGYILKIEIENHKNSLHKLNESWKNYYTNVEVAIKKLQESENFDNELSFKTARNFIEFMSKITQTKDTEVRISAIESVTEKVRTYEKTLPPKPIPTAKKSLLFYKDILNNYLSQMRTELEYWKKQTELEELEKQQQSLSQKMRRI
jgi:hypothetical protein